MGGGMSGGMSGGMGGGGGGMGGGFDARDNISARHMDHSRRRSYSQTYPSAEPQSMESISELQPLRGFQNNGVFNLGSVHIFALSRDCDYFNKSLPPSDRTSRSVFQHLPYFSAASDM